MFYLCYLLCCQSNASHTHRATSYLGLWVSSMLDHLQNRFPAVLHFLIGCSLIDSQFTCFLRTNFTTLCDDVASSLKGRCPTAGETSEVPRRNCPQRIHVRVGAYQDAVYTFFNMLNMRVLDLPVANTLQDTIPWTRRINRWEWSLQSCTCVFNNSAGHKL